jgi:5'-methylthioadenosine phosphorylase
MARRVVGVIGGTGLYAMEGLRDAGEIQVDTPFGRPSDAYLKGTLGEIELVFLPRHGRGHRLLPTEINFRANIFGMKKLGVEWIVSVSAVGSLREEIEPGHLLIPDQFIDRTTQRLSTFFGRGIVAHVSLADPFCPALRNIFIAAAKEAGASVHSSGTYVCMEGPQFSTRAESHLYRSWGAHVIGMTNLQEAKLAREAEICYATVAMVTDFDCWHPDHDSVTIQQVIEHLVRNSENAAKVLFEALPRIPAVRGCRCGSALENAIITARDMIPPQTRQKLGLLIEKYLGEK